MLWNGVPMSSVLVQGPWLSVAVRGSTPRKNRSIPVIEGISREIPVRSTSASAVFFSWTSALREHGSIGEFFSAGLGVENPAVHGAETFTWRMLAVGIL